MVKVILIVLLILALVLSASCLYLYNHGLSYDADVVVFMMGTNDSKPENWFGADAFKTEPLTLLDSHGDAKIYLCTLATAFFRMARPQGLLSTISSLLW